MVLKVCPFCGGEPAVMKLDPSFETCRFYAVCMRCGASTARTTSSGAAIILWNHRPDEDCKEPSDVQDAK